MKINKCFSIIVLFLFCAIGLKAQSGKKYKVIEQENDACVDFLFKFKIYGAYPDNPDDKPCGKLFSKKGDYKLVLKSNQGIALYLSLDKKGNIIYPIITEDNSTKKTKKQILNFKEGKLIGKQLIVNDVVIEKLVLKDSIYTIEIPNWKEKVKSLSYVDSPLVFIDNNESFEAKNVIITSNFNVDTILTAVFFDLNNVKRVAIDYTKRETHVYNQKGNLTKKITGAIVVPNYEYNYYKEKGNIIHQKSVLSPQNMTSFFNKTAQDDIYKDEKVYHVMKFDNKGTLIDSYTKKEAIQYGEKKIIKFYNSKSKKWYKKIELFSNANPHNKKVTVKNKTTDSIFYYKNKELLKQELKQYDEFDLMIESTDDY